MKYTVEFRISADVPEGQKERYIKYQKRNCNCELGRLIHKNIGYEENVYKDSDRFIMEVQTFSERDWNDFKFKLKQYIHKSNLDLETIGKLISNLECI